MSAGERCLCSGCGASVANVDGPVHKYVPSAPGCWRVFGELQAEESARFGYPSVHRLVVDAYMAQHPGDGRDRRDRQSVFVHLVGLCAALEQELAADLATNALRRVLRTRRDFPVLSRREGPGALTVLHLRDAVDRPDYERRATAWAKAVWDSWRETHPLIRAALADSYGAAAS